MAVRTTDLQLRSSAKAVAGIFATAPATLATPPARQCLTNSETLIIEPSFAAIVKSKHLADTRYRCASPVMSALHSGRSLAVAVTRHPAIPEGLHAPLRTQKATRENGHHHEYCTRLNVVCLHEPSSPEAIVSIALGICLIADYIHRLQVLSS
jgi:hypothetical protein